MIALLLGAGGCCRQPVMEQLPARACRPSPTRCSASWSRPTRSRKIVEDYVDRDNWLFLGRGYNYPVALEGALKLKEISYIHAEGLPAAEMKHGPIALIHEGMPVVFVAPQGPTYDKIISNIEEVRARRGRIIAVATEGDEDDPARTATTSSTCPTARYRSSRC